MNLKGTVLILYMGFTETFSIKSKATLKKTKFWLNCPKSSLYTLSREACKYV